MTTLITAAKETKGKLLENYNLERFIHVPIWHIWQYPPPPPGGICTFGCDIPNFRIQLQFINIISVTKWFVPAHQSSVLFALKICFDQILVVGIFWKRFQQEMQLRPGCFFLKFVPCVSLCGCPYDITASWLKAFHCF